MDVDLSVVQERDPKGLYEKVAQGLIKGFTGVGKKEFYLPLHFLLFLALIRQAIFNDNIIYSYPFLDDLFIIC